MAQAPALASAITVTTHSSRHFIALSSSAAWPQMQILANSD
jgi:hypothetical protein